MCFDGSLTMPEEVEVWIEKKIDENLHKTMGIKEFIHWRFTFLFQLRTEFYIILSKCLHKWYRSLCWLYIDIYNGVKEVS